MVIKFKTNTIKVVFTDDDLYPYKLGTRSSISKPLKVLLLVMTFTHIFFGKHH